MLRKSYNMFQLKEASLRGDNDKIISHLVELRKLSKRNEIDKNTFEILIDLIKVPNTKVINYALSILANCCSKSSYRTMFKEMGGVPHLLLVVKTIDNDSIICRACRLIGNLAMNGDLAKELSKNNVSLILLGLLEKHENVSSNTLLMVFRALKFKGNQIYPLKYIKMSDCSHFRAVHSLCIVPCNWASYCCIIKILNHCCKLKDSSEKKKNPDSALMLSLGNMKLCLLASKNLISEKLWPFIKFSCKMLPDELSSTFDKCLNSDDEQVIRLTIETLMRFIHVKKYKVTKELFLKIIELSRKEDLNHLAVLCLSSFICNQTSNVWNYLEGSSIAEVFIEYIQRSNDIDGGIYKAFQKLCTEGAIRNKVRVAGLLPRLIEMCNENNVKKFLATLYLFQYDLISMMICSQNPRFTSILIENILLPGAVPLLAVLSRLNPPVKQLVIQENLDVIIKTKECIGILKNIAETRQFLRVLLTSGRIWEIEKAGCSMEEVGSLGDSEGLIIQLLSSDDKKWKENVSLAIPFLVKPRNFELLYKLLARYQVITTIIDLLQENPEEERILASVIRLINIFRYNYHQSDIFFQGFVESSDNVTPMELVTEDTSLTETKTENSPSCTSDLETITFELDDGSCVVANKSLLCKSSPVLDSMLNGHFIEAQQDKVRLRRCSREAILYLEKLLCGKMDISDIGVETYLELISLTDRFLLTSLNNTLTVNLRVDASSCVLIYQWYRTAGYTKNNTIICKKIYEFLFSSSECLVLAMKNEFCRGPLVKEITNYLSNSLIDLL